MPKQIHRHAAIVFTDIVGYTAMMGKDEARAVEVLHLNKAIHLRIIPRFNGNLIKEVGDGMLISFDLASDAVRCSIELQKECMEQHIPLKIGIHEGETLFEDGDIIGDSVNIASRLQVIAPPGGIYISETVNYNIENKRGIEARFVKQETLKNVNHPVRIYQVNMGPAGKPVSGKIRKKILYYSLGGFLVIAFSVLTWTLMPRQQAGEVKKSIAVLPFDNESADEENQYFVNGMMEDIRNNLSKISDLQVKSKVSVNKYHKTNLSSKEIGRELDANYLLEGTVQKQGTLVKIHAQLIHAETDNHIWADTYQADIADPKEVFNIQSDIAQAIAKELHA
ncbi:MAG TPA: adenylate/guanylate cyclase domain-containing protein, partial [Cyclobacteriaceae bacterium]